MTSSVKVTAQCAEDTEVVILVYASETAPQEYVLNKGDTREVYVYDTRTVEVFERKKA